MPKSHLKLVPPTLPRRPRNADLRTREHLTAGEVEALVEAAKANRYGHRDATMILIAFRHGLRAAELCDLRWDQVEFGAAVLHVRQVKNGTPSTHPLRGDELRALRRLQRESETSPFVFVSERGSPFTTAGFARMVERAAAGAGLELKAHPHMLRHACGYALANKGHDARYPGLARAPLDHQYRDLYGTGAESVQGFLARVSEDRRSARTIRADSRGVFESRRDSHPLSPGRGQRAHLTIRPAPTSHRTTEARRDRPPQ
jgi:integrase